MNGFTSRVRDLFSALSRRQIIAILFSLVLLLAVPLTVFVAQQQQKTKQHASFTNPSSNFSSLTKDYQQLIAEKAIDPAREILEIGLSYDENKTPQLSFSTMKRFNGYAPYHFQELSETAYALQVLDQQNRVLEMLRFAIPNKSIGESFPKDEKTDEETDEKEKIEGQIAVLQQINFAQTLKWHSNASSVQLIGPKNNILSTQPLTNISKASNRPDFKVINGADIVQFQKAGKDINLNKFNMDNPILNFTKAFAQEQPARKVNIAIVRDASVPQNDFADYVKKIGDYLFNTVEPFHARASQINFIPVDNINSSRCSYVGNGYDRKSFLYMAYLNCDISAIEGEINVNGTPHDAIMVIVDLPIANAGVQGNAIYGKYGVFNVDNIKNIKDTNDDEKVIRNLLGFVFSHELGHALFELRDEYSSDIFFSPTGKSTDPYYLGINCYSGSIPNPKWEGLVGRDDYSRGCWYQDAYTPGKGGIMRGYSDFFLSVSQVAINKKIDEIAGKSAQDDTTAPEIKILPKREIDAYRDEDKELLKVRVDATDDRGVAWVQFWIDNIFARASYSGADDPLYFLYLVIPTDSKKQSFSVKAIAYDVAGNRKESEEFVVKSNFETTPTPTPVPIPGDYDKNGCISIDDYNKWSADYDSNKTEATIDAYDEWDNAYTAKQNLCK